MKTSLTSLLGLVTACAWLVLPGPLAAEVTGVVREVSGSTATVETSGRTPVIGAKAEIFFKLVGAEDEISVGSGTVVSKEGSSIQVKIEDASGDVSKDQLVRFTGESEPAVTRAKPPPTNEPTPAEAEVPAPTPTRTLPPSVPFPTAAPTTKATAAPASEIDPAAMQLIVRGTTQHAAGDIDGAIQSYTSALRIAPRVGVAYLNRANAYLYKPNFQAAIADANKALELTVPKMDDIYTVRGTAKAGLGDYDGGLADCNRALKINPKNALAYNNRANNKLRKGNYSAALSDCNKSISLDSTSALPYYNRGYIYVNTGNLAGALSDWKKAVRMQASFAAELNPKIAQLESRGVQTRESAPAKSAAAGPGEWVDLTNARQKIIGSWKGGRHVTQYLADGSFYTDPHLVPNPPRGQWRVEGDRLIRYFPQSKTTIVENILSVTENELVVRSNGQTFRLRRGTE